MIWFTSDCHFYHKNIITSCNRPFESIEQMHDSLIHNWNKNVKLNDEIYILGDFIWDNKQELFNITNSLNGKKYLIKGNHDNGYFKIDTSSIFEWVKPYYELKYNKKRFVLFHFPIYEWNGYMKGSIHLHGHVHNKDMPEFDTFSSNKLIYNVGVDKNNYSPISIESIMEKLNVI